MSPRRQSSKKSSVSIRPIVVQYVQWMGGLAHGDLGYSYVSEKPAIQEILPRIPITAKLAGLALCFRGPVRRAARRFSAVKQNSSLDYMLRVISLSGLVACRPSGSDC